MENVNNLKENILIQRTIDVFGYDPKELPQDSREKVIIFCLNCKKEMIESFFIFNFSNKIFLCRSCLAVEIGRLYAYKVSETNAKRNAKFIGMKFNHLLILELYVIKNEKNNRKAYCAKVQCDCGNIKEKVNLSELKNGHTKTCGSQECKFYKENKYEKQRIYSESKKNKRINSLKKEYEFEFLNQKYVVRPLREANEKDVEFFRDKVLPKDFLRHMYYVFMGCYCDFDTIWAGRLSSFLRSDTRSCGCIWKIHLSDVNPVYIINYNNLILRSAPELAFVLSLEKSNIKFNYEPKDNQYGWNIELEGKKTIYIPDFYVKETDTYYEIKYNIEKPLNELSLNKIYIFGDKYKFNVKMIDITELEKIMNIPLYKFSRIVWEGVEKHPKTFSKKLILDEDSQKLKNLRNFIEPFIYEIL